MSFKPIDVKRDEFRKYLERSGVLDAISKVFVKLLQQPDKPENALEFLYANLGVNKEQTDSYHRLKLELEDAHNEIANLKRTIEILEGEKSSKKSQSPPATAIMEATDKDNDSKSSENNQDDEMKDENKTAENDIAVIESASVTNEDSSAKGNDENEKNIESSSADEQQQQKESSELEKN